MQKEAEGRAETEEKVSRKLDHFFYVLVFQRCTTYKKDICVQPYDIIFID